MPTLPPTEKTLRKRPAEPVAEPPKKRPALGNDEKSLEEKREALKYMIPLIYLKLILGLVFFERMENQNAMDVEKIGPRFLFLLLMKMMLTSLNVAVRLRKL